MWGEIDPPAARPRPAAYARRVTREPPQSTRLDPETITFPGPHKPQTSPPHNTDTQVVSPGVKAMLEAVALSGSQVKSQQVGDADLTLDQRRQELLVQYKSRPLVFLERYQAHLKPQHLAAFSHLAADPRAQHYCRVIQRRPGGGHADRTRVRNHRYAALRALQREGQYFSEEQMRSREPLLYEQYIGQYLTDDELMERSQALMQDGAAAGGPDGAEEGCASGGLAHILLNSYQERLLQSRLEEEQEREDGAEEEEDDEEDNDGGYKDGRREDRPVGPTADEKALLREEFVGQMHQRFLAGQDKDFNYSEVDENPDYDNLDIVSRDAEEKYFDDDDDEEEEEEEEEEEDEEEGADHSENKDGDDDERMTE